MIKKRKTRVGVLISGGGTNMQAIVKACQDYEVVFVGADNPDAKGLIWAEDQKISNFFVDYLAIKKDKKRYTEIMGGMDAIDIIYGRSIFVHELFEGDKVRQLDYLRWKTVAEDAMYQKIKEFKIDLLVLAGFMQVCTSYLINSLHCPIMNIHPALLPSFPGVNGYEDTINYGCKVGGCTVHFIDYGEDTGPIIGQRAIPVLPKDDIESFRKKGLQEEYELFPECIQLFAEGRLKIESVTQCNGSERKVVKTLGGRSG